MASLDFKKRAMEDDNVNDGEAADSSAKRSKTATATSEDGTETSDNVANSSEAMMKSFIENQKLLSSQSVPTTLTPHVFKTNTKLIDSNKLKILVTGGAGFVGSHLVDKLMIQGHEIICLDNFFTGSKSNIEHWLHHPNFTLIRHDIIEPILLEVDQIYHLACPASPPHYQYNPVKTIKTSTIGSK